MGGGKRCYALALGLVAALMLAGCAATVGGSPVAQRGAGSSSRPSPQSPSPTSSASRAATAWSMLGELTTIDPCSLVDTKEFSEFGTAELVPPASLDECQVMVKTSAPAPVILFIGSLDRTESYPDLAGKKSTEVSRGLKVVDYEDDSDGDCIQLLVFADNVTLSVNGPATTEPKLCDIVQTAMDRVVTVVRGGDVKHFGFGSKSLGRLDPCAVTPTPAVAAVPGLESVKAKSYPAKHACSWTARDNSARVRVEFGMGSPPKAVGEGATERPISDRPTVVSQTPNAGSFAFCSVSTGHIPFTAKDQSGIVEIATIFVRMRQGQVDQACTGATGIAAAVWPKLPKP